MDSRTIDFSARRAQMTGSSSTAARLRSSTSAASGFRATASAGASYGTASGRGFSGASYSPRPAVTSYTPPRRGISAALRAPFEALQLFISRIGRRLFFAGLAIAVVGICVLRLYGPARDYYVARRTNDYLSAQLATLTAQNDRVEQQISALQTQEGIEDEARRRGYVEVGSNAVSVTGLPSSDVSTTGSAVLDEKSAEELPWYVDILDSLFQYTPPES